MSFWFPIIAAVVVLISQGDNAIVFISQLIYTYMKIYVTLIVLIF